VGIFLLLEDLAEGCGGIAEQWPICFGVFLSLGKMTWR